jgi:hypothetical protein
MLFSLVWMWRQFFFFLLLAPRAVCLRCNQYCFSSKFQERLSPVLCTVNETDVKYHEIVLSLRRQHRRINPQVVEMDDVCLSALWLGPLIIVMKEM